MPSVSDPRIEELFQAISEISDELAFRLAELATATDAASRIAMRSEARQLLNRVRVLIDTWLADTLPGMVTEMDVELLGAIDSALSQEDSQVPWTAMVLAVRMFDESLSAAMQSVDATINALVRGDARAVLAGDGPLLTAAITSGSAARIAKARQQAAKSFRTGMIRVLGTNGKTYRYEPGYYVSLAADSLRGNVQAALVRSRAETLGVDLLQVSENPSTIGDYCDLYRGKVFSISGTSSVYPPLAWAPAGGTPFHPWCHHRMTPFSDANLTDAEKRHLANIPDDFLQLGKDRASVNQFQRRWINRKAALGFR